LRVVAGAPPGTRGNRAPAIIIDETGDELGDRRWGEREGAQWEQGKSLDFGRCWAKLVRGRNTRKELIKSLTRDRWIPKLTVSFVLFLIFIFRRFAANASKYFQKYFNEPPPSTPPHTHTHAEGDLENESNGRTVDWRLIFGFLLVHT